LPSFPISIWYGTPVQGSTPSIVWNTPRTNVSNADTLKEGDAIVVGGTFQDEYGLPLTTTYYLASALNELTNNLQVYGLEDLSANVTASLNATGGFEIVYIIPNGYSNENISLWFEIRNNPAVDTFDLVNSFVQVIFTYQVE